MLSIMVSFVFDSGMTFGEMIQDLAVQKKWKMYMETG